MISKTHIGDTRDNFQPKVKTMRIQTTKIYAIYIVVMTLLVLPLTTLARELPDFTTLIEQKSKAVVKITTITSARTSRQFPGQDEIPEQFRRFFEFDPRQQTPERVPGGLGSGFLISEDGYILTNNHVIDGAEEINIQMLDRREFEAKVIGTDPRSDLALLKIDADDLPYLTFAKANDIKIGEWVVAIGSPFNMDFSASQGIVSAIGRSIGGGDNNYVPFIQTDVAINPGNSGGPLFNLDGEVVGINAQIYTRSGGFMGLSFAIPTSVALTVVEQLKANGKVERGWLGVQITDVDRDQAIAFGLKKPAGALVQDVSKGGPAEEYGLKPGDIILEFNGVDINQSGDLPHVVGQTPPGRKVPIRIMRERRERKLDVVIGTLEGMEVAGRLAPSSPQEPSRSESGRLGVVVEPLPETLAESYRIDGGILIAEVLPDSPASRAGLRQGDVVVEINFKAVADVENFSDIVKDLPSGSLLPLRFYRQGTPRIITFKIDN